ncbi:UV radiation resistance associated protein [Nymphon striatum]|nr:UV radiation resistance associated protein [Nymphon striatum]
MDAGHVRKRHVSISTQQHRLRHLKGIFARNINPDLFPNVRDGFMIYYSIHHIPSKRVIYTSEVIEDCLNPNWGVFEMSHFPDNIPSSTSSICVKVWCYYSKHATQVRSNPNLIIEWTVNFNGLSYLGEQIPKDGKIFHYNSLIFVMVEGHYSCVDCLISSTKSEVGGNFVFVEANSLRPSYNVSSIQRIHTVQRAMKQTKSAVRKEWGQIQKKLAHLKERKQIKSETELKAIKIQLLKDKLEHQSVRVKHLSEKVHHTKCSQDYKCIEIIEKLQSVKKAKESLNEDYRKYNSFIENLIKTKSHISLRWKQLVTDLIFVYPIVEVHDRPHKVCDVSLPNSEDFAGHNDVMICVGLGYVVHILLMLSHLLDIPLRYPVQHFGSRSTIMDHIIDKIEPKDRIFPLFSKGKDKIRFTYGVYLLNKNIAQLRHYLGLSTRDLRATLPNLLGIIELLLKEKYSIRGDMYMIQSPGNFVENFAIYNTNSEKSKVTEHSEMINSENTSHKSSVIYQYNNKSINDPMSDCSDTLKKLCNAEEMAGGSKNPASSYEYNDTNLSKEALLALNHSSPQRKIDKVFTSMNNNFSFSLDQGLNNLYISSSPVHRVCNSPDIKITRPLSTSNSEIALLNEDNKGSFYKASVNMWKNVPSSDDEFLCSHLSNVESGNKINSNERDIGESVETSESSESKINQPISSLSENIEKDFKLDVNNDIKDNVLSCKTKDVNNFDEEKDSFDCDIASRVELLARRSVLGCRCLSLSLVPRIELANWGLEHLEKLNPDNFTQIDPLQTRLEFGVLKELVLTHSYTRGVNREFWSKIFQNHKDDLPNRFKLAALTLSIPTGD